MYTKDPYKVSYHGVDYTIQQIADKLGCTRQRVHIKCQKFKKEPDKYPIEWLFNEKPYDVSVDRVYIKFNGIEWSVVDISKLTKQSTESVYSRIRRYREDPVKYPVEYIFSTHVRKGRPRKPSIFSEPEL